VGEVVRKNWTTYPCYHPKHKMVSQSLRTGAVRFIIILVFVTLLLLAYRVAKYAYSEAEEESENYGAQFSVAGGQNSQITGRQFAQVAYCKNLNSVIIIGGARESSPAFVSRDNWIYSFDSETWTALENSIVPRAGGSLTVIADEPNNCTMLLQGGFTNWTYMPPEDRGIDTSSVFTNIDSYVISIMEDNDGMNSLAATKVDRFEQAMTSAHTSIFWNGSVYFFGGIYKDKDNEASFSGIYRFDVAAREFESVPTSGAVPLSRPGIVSALVEDSENTQWILYGGKSGSMFKGMWSFSFKSSSWRQISGVNTEYPTKTDLRSYARMAYYNNHVFIFSGRGQQSLLTNMIVAELDLNRNQFRCPKNPDKENFCVVRFKGCTEKTLECKDWRTNALVDYGGFAINPSSYSLATGVRVGTDGLGFLKSEILTLSLDQALGYLESDLPPDSFMIFQLVLIVSVITFLLATVLLVVQRPNIQAITQAEPGSSRRGGAAENTIKSLPLVTYSKELRKSDYSTQNKKNTSSDLENQVSITNLTASSGEKVEDAELCLTNGTDSTKMPVVTVDGKETIKSDSATQSASLSDTNLNEVSSGTTLVNSGSAMADAVNNNDDDSDICAICICEYEAGDQVRLLPCQHYFHGDCIDVWLRKNKACPMCKQDIVARNQANIQPAVIVAATESSNNNRRVRPNMRFSLRLLNFSSGRRRQSGT